jgi:transposase
MRRKGSKVHLVVDTLGHLLTLHVTAADEQDRAQVEQLAQAVQEVTGDTVEVAFVDQGYTGTDAADQAARHEIDLLVVKHTEAKRGFVLLPCRWVVERSFGWQLDFTGWREIMSGSRKPWPDCTTSPFYASCSVKPSLYSPQVHNRL